MYQRATKWMDETICSELQGSFPAAHCILSHPSIWWLSGTSPSVPCCPSFRQSFWQLASNARPPAQQVRGSSDSTNFCRPSIAGAPGIVEPLAVDMHDGFGGHVHKHFVLLVLIHRNQVLLPQCGTSVSSSGPSAWLVHLTKYVFHNAVHRPRPA